MIYDYGGGPVMYPNMGTFNIASSGSLQTITTMAASGQACHLVGQVFIDGRPSAAKTFSSAGGKIHFMAGACTFANAGTTLRVGIQDANLTTGSPARGDGTFDTYKDMVGGTDTITANAYNTVTMASGTKSITHGDMIAIVFNMTARGGADSVIVQGLSQYSGGLFHLPQCTAEAAAVFTTQPTVPDAIIEFDDGTLGWVYGTMPVDAGPNNVVSFNSGSTPDEYGTTVQFPRPVSVEGMWAFIVAAGSGPSEFLIYSDPMGTPTLVTGATYSFDHDLKQSANERFVHVLFPQPVTLAANTRYGVTMRPTTTDNITAHYFRVANANYFKAMTGGIYSTYISRTNNAGAFTETTTRRLEMGLLISGGDEGQGPLPTYQLGV